MPIFEMPLEKLKIYQGINPKPEDFDEFWSDALRAADAVSPQVEITPAKFATPFAECFDLWYTGTKEARIYAKYLRPKNGGGIHPAVIAFHGYHGNSGDWAAYFKWVLAGYSVFVMDCRGQGGNSEDTGGTMGPTVRCQFIRGVEGKKEDLLYRQIFLDAVLLTRIAAAQDEVDPEQLFTTGGSQGGGLALACAALVPQIKRAAVMYPYLSDYKRVLQMDLGDIAYDGLSYYFRVRDPRHEREEAFFTRLGYIDIQHLAKRIRGDVLVLTGLMDKICPASTQFATYNKIESNKQMKIYPEFGHERLPDAEDLIFEFLTRA